MRDSPAARRLLSWEISYRPRLMLSATAAATAFFQISNGSGGAREEVATNGEVR